MTDANGSNDAKGDAIKALAAAPAVSQVASSCVAEEGTAATSIPPGTGPPREGSSSFALPNLPPATTAFATTRRNRMKEDAARSDILTDRSTASLRPVSLPLPSPSMTSSPSRELASSEEESVAEMGDVSEGECSSVEDFHDPETMRRRLEIEEEEERLSAAQDGRIDSSCGVVAVAQQISKMERQAPAMCERFSAPDDDTESLIDHPISSPPLSAPALASHEPAAAAVGNIGNATDASLIPSPDNLTAACIFDKTTKAASSLCEATNKAAPSNPFSFGSKISSNLKVTTAVAATGSSKKSTTVAPMGRTLPTNFSVIESIPPPPSSATTEDLGCDHLPTSLPAFKEPRSCMWTSSHAANSPSEDRSSSLVNVLLQPLPPNIDSETQLPAFDTSEYNSLIRLNLWSVIDGHGGGCVATYASEVLLPHIAASISRALGCAIVSRGVCLVNGQLRDANALDLDGLIKTSDRSPANPNSIHYRSPREASDSDDDDGDGEGGDSRRTILEPDDATHDCRDDEHGNQDVSSLGGSPPPTEGASSSVAPSNSSVKTSVKTAASVVARDAPVGTHSPSEVAAITQAITDSFLAVDEGWINSIDPVATHQTSCQSNGRWNSGACALTVFTIQRLEWTSVSEDHRERELRGAAKNRGHDTSQNKDAARRRMLDYATRAKIARSLSTTSSTSSLTTTDDRVNASGLESEITETEGEDDEQSTDDADENPRRRSTFRRPDRGASLPKQSLISAPGGCSCHCYRAYDALLYTAHVGDCRALLLGSAPPRTIKVHGSTPKGHENATDDESSHHSSDETECLSSSDHDADSSDDEEIEVERDQMSAAAVSKSTSPATPSYMAYVRRRARRKSRRRRYDDLGMNAPFIALPPLEGFRSVEIEIDSDYESRRRRHHHMNNGSIHSDSASSSSTSSRDSREFPPAILLPQVTRPIDLTTDHSAYNPAEVSAVLRRCNNAPLAISAGVGGGIMRVAGSLAVTRALGDAYLKTPLLSFFPYKRHAPYITGRPEVNCRPVVKGGDKVLVLATDGVWERANGEDVLRWVRTFYAERIAEAERRSNIGRLNKIDTHCSDDASTSVGKRDDDSVDSPGQEQPPPSPQRDDIGPSAGPDVNVGRKRDVPSSPGQPVPGAKRRKLTGRPTTAPRAAPFGSRRNSTVADVIVRRVLNKVRRARNISSLHTLMSLPPGRARRSKHDDITACVVDLSAFVS